MDADGVCFDVFGWGVCNSLGVGMNRSYREGERVVVERPILFSGEMVRAILDGSKSQTRRVVKGRALEWLQPGMFAPSFVAAPENGLSPYGHAGNRLWVRETWTADIEVPDDDGFKPYWYHEAPETFRTWVGANYIHYRADNVIVHGGRHGGEFHEYPWEHRVATYVPPVEDLEGRRWLRWMPRWASRITLEITGVRVERLQAITSTDAWAEGVRPDSVPEHAGDGTRDAGDPESATLEAFAALWNGINEKRGYGWDTNPWVWVIEFARTTDESTRNTEHPASSTAQ